MIDERCPVFRNEIIVFSLYFQENGFVFVQLVVAPYAKFTTDFDAVDLFIVKFHVGSVEIDAADGVFSWRPIDSVLIDTDMRHDLIANDVKVIVVDQILVFEPV